MDRALWVVVGKVASLLLLGSLVSLGRAEPLALVLVAIALAAYAVAMANLLRTGTDDEPPGRERPHPPGHGYVTDGGRWSRDA